MRYRSQAPQARDRERDFVRQLCLSGERMPLESLDLGSLDWSQCIQYALYHGLAPLLWQGLRRGCEGACGLSPGPDGFAEPAGDLGIPARLFSSLRENYLSTMRLNLLRQDTLSELDGALEGTGITCLVWKGGALNINVYRHPALRPMDDVDLLIPSNDLEAFEAVAGRLGFRAMSRFPLVWVRGKVTLDLHLDAVHSDRIPGRLQALPVTAETLAREAYPLGSFHHLKTLSPRDTLISLAVHGMKHGFSRDIWLADALFLLQGHPWLVEHSRGLIRRAEALGAATPLYLFLTLLSVSGQREPSDLLGKLPPRRLGFLTRQFIACFAAGHAVPHVGDLFFSTLIDSRKEKIAFLKGIMFPSRQVIDQTFPLKGFRPYWPYYALRIIRLIHMGARVLSTLVHPPGQKAC